MTLIQKGCTVICCDYLISPSHASSLHPSLTATPKSPILTRPSLVIRRLAGLISVIVLEKLKLDELLLQCMMDNKSATPY